MADKTKIEWTDSSWTPIRARNLKTGKTGWHCEHATTGCEFCYAEGMNKRLGTGLAFKPGHRKDVEIFLDDEMLLAPLRWKRPRMIFVCSMTDLFADFVSDEMIDRVFAVMALSPQHTFQVLTKRAGRMREYCKNFDLQAIARYHAPSIVQKLHREWPLSNVWLGVSAERQQEWDERKEHLAATPAAIRFASFEPLLGPIVEPRPLSDFIHWAIVGGESGSKARAPHPQWIRSLHSQCTAANVAFFFKQWGEWAPSTPVHAKGNPHSGWRTTKGYPHVARAEELYPEAGAAFVERVGKKAAGRLLDGVEYNEMPETAR